jgi:hypothetical protein
MERNKEGLGRPGAPTELPSPKEQGSSKTTPEGGKDYRGMLSSIKANQDLETFVADLRQNKEQLFSFAQEFISGKAVPAKTKKEAKDNTALGIYMDFAVRYILNPDRFSFEVFSTNPADWRDGYTYHKPITEAEKREQLVDRAARRIASKWLDGHPDSGAAMHIEAFGINEVNSSIHCELLQEMWLSICDKVLLPQK